MTYKKTRSYENLQKAIYPGVGKYGIPQLKPSYTKCDDWIGFNYVRGCEEPEELGVHFFLDDYQFARVWNRPDAYLPKLKLFDTVCTPDFSTFADFPVAVQIYNHYRKHWLGAYWQAHGVHVIPTISWSDEDSYDWCFDGEPVGGCVAVSSVGTQKGAKTRQAFRSGYREMLQRLHPCQILFYGAIPEDCANDHAGIPVIEVPAYQQRFKHIDTEIDSPDVSC